MQKENKYYYLISKYRKELMGLAALLILYFHDWVYIFDDILLLSKIEHLGKHIFNFGVDIFFFLSGFGLVNSINKNTKKQFYLKRFKRLFLPFIICGIAFSLHFNWSLIDTIKAFTGYSFLFENMYKLLWFTFAILILYLIFPYYYQLLSKSKNQMIFTAITIAAIITTGIILKVYIREDLYGFINRIPVFVVGVYIGQSKTIDALNITKKKNIVIFILGIIGLILSYLMKYKGISFILPVGECFIPYSLMSISVCFLFPQFLEAIKNKIILNALSFYGSISYELYCCQEIVAFIILDPIRNKYPAILLNIGFLIFISVLSYILLVLNKAVTNYIDSKTINH